MRPATCAAVPFLEMLPVHEAHQSFRLFCILYKAVPVDRLDRRPITDWLTVELPSVDSVHDSPIKALSPK